MTAHNDTLDLLAAVLTGVLYVAPLISIPLALYYLAKKRRRLAWVWGLVAVVSLAPLLAFLAIYYDAVTFPGRRQEQVAQFPREPLAAGQRPRTLTVEGELATAARLVVVGFLDEIIQYPDGRSWPKIIRWSTSHDANCVDENINPAIFGETQSAAMLARSAYMVCPRQTRLDEAPSDPPPIELLRDGFSGLAIRDKPGQHSYNFTYRAWELRSAPALGAKLIDYAEVLYVEEPAYHIDWQMGFYHGDGRRVGDRNDWNSYEFVAAALGLDPVKDVAFSATPEDLSQAMTVLVQRMNAGKGGRGDALRLLLGQWGANPILRDGLLKLDMQQAGPFITESLMILATSANDAKRRQLYPKLHEYRDELMRFCPMIADPAQCRETLPEIEKRALEGAYSES